MGSMPQTALEVRPIQGMACAQSEAPLDSTRGSPRSMDGRAGDAGLAASSVTTTVPVLHHDVLHRSGHLQPADREHMGKRTDVEDVEVLGTAQRGHAPIQHQVVHDRHSHAVDRGHITTDFQRIPRIGEIEHKVHSVKAAGEHPKFLGRCRIRDVQNPDSLRPGGEIGPRPLDSDVTNPDEPSTSARSEGVTGLEMTGGAACIRSAAAMQRMAIMERQRGSKGMWVRYPRAGTPAIPEYTGGSSKDHPFKG
jgi:hypothetical protein